MGLFVIRNVRFHRLVGKTGRRAGIHLQELARVAAAEMGWKRPVEIVETGAVETPAVIGLVTPKLLLPEGIANRLSDQDLMMVFRHEIAHLKRCDLAVNFLCSLLQIVHWFNPFLWWAFGRMRNDREMATDAFVLSRQMEHRESYGTTLLKLASEQPSHLPLRPSIGILEGKQQLSQRIEQIARLKSNAYAWSTLGIILLIVLGFTTLTKAPHPHRKDIEPLPRGAELRRAVAVEFHQAVCDGDIDRVQGLLDRGIDVNDKADARTALYEATHQKNYAMVSFLLKKGAHPDDKSYDRHTPMEEALGNGDRRIIDALIAAGAAHDPIDYATAMGDIPSLQRLDAATPIAHATLLFEIGLAASAGHLDTVDWLWEKAKPLSDQENTKALETLMEKAASKGRMDLLKAGKQRGFDFSSDASYPLYLAVENNQPKAAAYLLDQGVVPPQDKLDRLLFTAADFDSVDVGKVLLDHGARPNAPNDSGQTVLIRAINHWVRTGSLYLPIDDDRELAFVRLLIERGADINAVDSLGMTAAWHAACGYDSSKILQLLLQHGASVKGALKNGDTILTSITGATPTFVGWARHYDAAECAKIDANMAEKIHLLVGAGADINKPGWREMSPLLQALWIGNPAMALALIDSGADVQVRDKDGNTTLATAVAMGAWGAPISVDVVKALLDKSVNPNLPYLRPGEDQKMGGPPSLVKDAVELAAVRALGEPDEAAHASRLAVATLIERGGRVSSGNDATAEKWLKAAALGNLNQLQALREQGVSVDQADANGWTALLFSLGLRNDAVTEWLLNQGASLTTATTEGFNPLWFAVADQKEDLVTRILQAGADPTKMPYGDSMIDIAYERGNNTILRQLVEAGAKSSTLSVFRCIQYGDPTTAQFLIDHGAPVDPDDNEEHRGNVYWAVDYNQPEILKMLLDHGADPTRRTTYNETPLSDAQRRNNLQMVEMLTDAIKKWPQNPPRAEPILRKM